MIGSSLCCTVFFSSARDVLAAQYQAIALPADGYLTQLNENVVLVDALATETADWGRQMALAEMMVSEDATAISLFSVGRMWGIAISHGQHPGVAAAFDPEATKMLDELPYNLLTIEKSLATLFPGEVDTEQVDYLFGALLDGGISAEEAFGEILGMLGCPSDWARWSWYELIPQQLFLDPDLGDRVTPLGQAQEFWEE